MCDGSYAMVHISLGECGKALLVHLLCSYGRSAGGVTQSASSWGDVAGALGGCGWEDAGGRMRGV